MPAHPAQRQRTITVVSVVLTLIVLAAYVAFDSGPLGTQVRQLVGVDGRLRPAVEPQGRAGGHYVFLDTQPGSEEPVTWSPCKPIRYLMNPDGSPPDSEELIADAVEEVGRRTGLEFEYEGTTDSRAFDERIDPADRPLPVLIGWADPDEVPELEGDVAGLAGPVTSRLGARSGYVSGKVLFDEGLFDSLAGSESGAEVMRAIVLHELGHLVGLGHVDDTGEIMHGKGVTRTTFGTGDLEGLARLGASDCR